MRYDAFADDETYGPTFRWFAWRPVFTYDRGWRWLRPVWRRRCFVNSDVSAFTHFEHSVQPF